MTEDLDLTIFANSLTNRAHQQDDYRFATNAIYSKMLSDSPMVIPYSDITNHWAKDAIESLITLGVMNGMGDGTFAPDKNLTRAMMVTMLYRMTSNPTAGAANPFLDVAADSWYADSIMWALADGIVKGISDDTFAPNQEITRQEMVVMLYRWVMGEDLTSSTDVPDLLPSFADGNTVAEWATDAMNWAIQLKLIQGRGGNQLAPSATATRAEVATFLSNVLSYAEI